MVCLALAAVLLSACKGAGGESPVLASPSPANEDWRLLARPSLAVRERCRPGTHELHLGVGRPALLRVPGGSAVAPRALIVALHGAGGKAPDGLWAFRAAWESEEILLVAPAFVGRSWSLSGGEDLRRIDLVLRRVFERCRVDPRRVAIGGHSAGASLALVLGIVNGDLFRSVMAFSPGAGLPGVARGRPRFFVAHGRRDDVIPIEAGGDAVVAELRARGYHVTYRRHPGGHEVPGTVSQAALRWFGR